MRLLLDESEAVAAWVAERIEGKPTFANFQAIGIVSPTRGLVGGVVFHDYKRRHASIQISVAFEPMALTKRIISAIFAYPFQQLGCRRMYACISEHNEQSLKLTRGIGFRQEGIMRQAGLDGEDLIMLSLLRDENKWNG